MRKGMAKRRGVYRGGETGRHNAEGIKKTQSDGRKENGKEEHRGDTQGNCTAGRKKYK